jgi:hypothetical protein
MTVIHIMIESQPLDKDKKIVRNESFKKNDWTIDLKPWSTMIIKIHELKFL